MKVAQLARFLDSLVQGLDGVVTAPVTKEMRSFSLAMQPFADASVTEFTSFLERFGAEFQQTGKISPQGKITVPKAAKAPNLDSTEQIGVAVATIQDLFAEIDRGSVNEARIEETLKPVAKMTIPQLHEILVGLKIAEKPRAKAKILDTIKQVIRHQMESRSRAASAGGGKDVSEVGRTATPGQMF